MWDTRHSNPATMTLDNTINDAQPYAGSHRAFSREERGEITPFGIGHSDLNWPVIVLAA